MPKRFNVKAFLGESPAKRSSSFLNESSEEEERDNFEGQSLSVSSTKTLKQPSPKKPKKKSINSSTPRPSPAFTLLPSPTSPASTSTQHSPLVTPNANDEDQVYDGGESPSVTGSYLSGPSVSSNNSSLNKEGKITYILNNLFYYYTPYTD